MFRTPPTGVSSLIAWLPFHVRRVTNTHTHTHVPTHTHTPTHTTRAHTLDPLRFIDSVSESPSRGSATLLRVHTRGGLTTNIIMCSGHTTSNNVSVPRFHPFILESIFRFDVHVDDHHAPGFEAKNKNPRCPGYPGGEILEIPPGGKSQEGNTGNRGNRCANIQ